MGTPIAERKVTNNVTVFAVRDQVHISASILAASGCGDEKDFVATSIIVEPTVARNIAGALLDMATHAERSRGRGGAEAVA